MSKFNCEINTDTKAVTFTIDGKEIDVYDFSLSRYHCCDWGDSDGDKKEKIYTSASYTTYDPSTKNKSSMTISFDNNNSVTQSQSSFSIAEVIYKAISSLYATENLSKALASYRNKK